MSSDSSPMGDTPAVVEDLGEARWTLDCDCGLLDTYGGENMRQLALEHVRETGHTVNAKQVRYGHFRPPEKPCLLRRPADLNPGDRLIDQNGTEMPVLSVERDGDWCYRVTTAQGALVFDYADDLRIAP